MSYARNLLSRGEEIVHESRQHWFAIIARTWIWLLVAILALAIVIFLFSGSEPIGNPTVDTLIAVIALAALLVAAGAIGLVLWDWRNQEWLVTTRRVIRAEGVLNKQMSDSSLEKINDARLEQSLAGRIFGYGTLDILTAAEESGASSVADFPMIADPIDFKRAMLDQKEMLERPDLAPPRRQRPGEPPQMERAEPMPPRAGSDRVSVRPDEPEPRPVAPPPPAPAQLPAPAPSPTPADELAVTLERLAGLRDRGLITPEEYEAKKRELLERV